jgi:uncharacterized membrane protein
MIESFLKKRTVPILFVFNVILAVVSWGMSIFAYPRLPEQIPIWLDIQGQPFVIVSKSPLFFFVPLVQTGLFLGLYLFARLLSNFQERLQVRNIMKESVLLVVIFFHMIFIHIQRGLVFAAHGVEGGFNRFYFYALFVIILVLIPYFRIRLKLIDRL